VYVYLSACVREKKRENVNKALQIEDLVHVYVCVSLRVCMCMSEYVCVCVFVNLPA